MAKRSNGEGSVRKRSNGSWEARLVYVDEASGALRRQSFYGRTGADARKQMQAARARLATGSPVVDATITVASWSRQWLETTVAASSRRGTTKDLYERLARVHIEPPPFGQLQLDRVRPTDVEALILRLRAEGLAAATVQRIFVVLRLSLDGAVRDGMIARNPASAVKAPSIERTEAVHLEPGDVVTLLDHAAGTRYSALFRLIATTGLRKGEALALTWDSLDLEGGALHVRGTLARTGNGLFVAPPKTALSRRTLPLARAEVELLTVHRAAQLAERELAGPAWSDEGFVFTTETGHPMDPRNVLRALTTAASKAGLTGVNVHTLRHSAATAWIEAGVNIKAVSTLLGHADIRITADVYGHVSDAVARAAMETLSDILRR
ncbi:tyrosine-type recombinase/integrase [Cellulomonas hominis]